MRVPTTLENWEVDGTNLNTLAFNIETIGGRMRVPQGRGEDIDVPYRPGQVWRPKFPSSRILTLGMWVIGAEEDGSVPSVGSAQRIQFNENWDKLIRLFYKPGRQLALTRRLAMSAGILETDALAELVSDMDRSMFDQFGARFTVDLKLADPYFYDAAQVLNTGIGPTVLTNVGHDRIRKGLIRFNGPLTNPRLTNTTLDPDVWVQWTGVLTAGQWVELDIDLFTAVRNTGANAISGVSHDGARRWMEYELGANALTLSASAGTGNVDITYQSPYV